jgi:replicative DNA helicase
MIPESLYSVVAERTCLGGLIKNPKVLIDLDLHFGDTDFFFREHRIIFSILRSMILGGQNIDKVVLAQKCKDLNLNNFNELDIFSYIDSAVFTQINSQGIVDLCKTLIKLRIKRELWESANQIQDYIKNSKDSSVDTMISDIDSIYK